MRHDNLTIGNSPGWTKTEFEHPLSFAYRAIWRKGDLTIRGEHFLTNRGMSRRLSYTASNMQGFAYDTLAQAVRAAEYSQAAVAKRAAAK